MPDDHPRPSPDRRGPRAGSRVRRRKAFDLSGVQLVATALAAIVATFAASYLGVAGTVLGAALFSVVTAVSKEVFGKSLSKTGERVREAVPVTRVLPRVPVGVGGAGGAGVGDHGDTFDASPGSGPDHAPDRADTDTVPPEHPSPMPRTGARPAWQRIALVAGLVFLGVLLCVTAVEVFAGRPISDIVRGDSGKGTTVFGNEQIRTKTVPPTAPTVTVTVTPKVTVVTPTQTQTAPAVTTSVPGPTATTTAPSSPAPSTSAGSASSSPTATPTTPSPSPSRSTRTAP